ncbi:Co-chaperone protein HscB [Phycisphaerae bacterium RAS2]|nr:Co-chaperone protein HscB [Phycisphaerae bacterium RAS2]
MTAPTTRSATSCDVCERLRGALPRDANWGELVSHVERADYFELFGLARAYQVDVAALQAAYMAISRNIHPDRFALADAAIQSAAMRASAIVNRAYETLKDAFTRAEYLLETAGGQTAAQDRRVPPELLGQVMMMREELEEARADSDDLRIQSIRAAVLEQRRAAQSAVAELCNRLADQSAEVRDALRLKLNGLKYLNNLLSTIDTP